MKWKDPNGTDFTASFSTSNPVILCDSLEKVRTLNSTEAAAHSCDESGN